MRYLLIIAIFALSACTNTAMQEELSAIKQELKTAKEKIDDLEAQIEPEGVLIHHVLFTVKPDADKTALITAIKKLEDIEEVLDLEVGSFEELGDARALSQYGVSVQMSFADKKAYEVYQKHPIHVALRENTKHFMAAPPATYDFRKQ